MPKSPGLLAAAAALLGACATAPVPASDPAGETVIPFMSSIRSLEWKAVSDQAAYVRGGNGDWFLVRTANRCTRLRAATAIGFDVAALDQLDRYGALLVQGQRCPIASITRSEGPPKKTRRSRSR
jgi:hypothetical protein